MKFEIFHNDYFDSLTGAFSRVTDRENYDSQITLTDVEAEIVIKHFGKESIHIGNVNSNPGAARKTFLLYPELHPINLNLVFPKPDKTELRLYLSNKAGFKPLANDIWFIYETNAGELVIGSLPENLWRDLGQTDIVDEEYQGSIENALSSGLPLNVSPNGKISERIINGQTIYVRDPRLAIMRFEMTGYNCEINSSHKTFIAEKTRRPYMEAHHFIPMKFQSHFEEPLDNFNNIVALCPNCHRGIHYGIVDHKIELIESLYTKRPELQEFSLYDIAQFYNAAKITI